MSWEEVKKINSDLSTPLDTLIRSIGCVKNVQRGRSASTQSGATVTAAISTIVPSKSFVLVDNRCTGGTKADTYIGARVQVLSTNSITFFSAYVGTEEQEFSWQVIEFY